MFLLSFESPLHKQTGHDVPMNLLWLISHQKPQSVTIDGDNSFASLWYHSKLFFYEKPDNSNLMNILRSVLAANLATIIIAQ